jgi:hypothetical protein
MSTHRPGSPVPEMRRCARCSKPARADRMIKGFGRDCATRLGLVGETVDVGQEGPDLFDAAEEKDSGPTVA